MSAATCQFSDDCMRGLSKGRRTGGGAGDGRQAGGGHRAHGAAKRHLLLPLRRRRHGQRRALRLRRREWPCGEGATEALEAVPRVAQLHSARSTAMAEGYHAWHETFVVSAVLPGVSGALPACTARPMHQTLQARLLLHAIEMPQAGGSVPGCSGAPGPAGANGCLACRCKQLERMAHRRRQQQRAAAGPRRSARRRPAPAAAPPAAPPEPRPRPPRPRLTGRPTRSPRTASRRQPLRPPPRPPPALCMHSGDRRQR